MDISSALCGEICGKECFMAENERLNRLYPVRVGPLAIAV